MARTLTRRSLLKAGVTAGAALATPTILTRKASAQTETTLKVVQWKHFVPDYDRYFNTFVKEFGEKNKCKVEVDYVATPDLPTSIAADISRGGGHDVFHLNGVGAWLYDQALVDVTSVANKLEKEFGGWIPNSESIGKVKGKWLAIPYWYIAYPLLINRGYFQQAGVDYTDKTSWTELLASGAKLKAAGHPFGIPYSQTPDANDDLYPLMAAYGAYFFDKEGKINFRRKEISECLEYGKKFFDQTMTDEVLSWDDSSNNRFIASGKGSMVCNPISAYRTAAKDNPDVYRNLEVVRTPLGPKGRKNGARTMSYGIFNFSKNQDLAKQFLYAMVADSHRGMQESTGYNHPFLKSFTKKPMPVLGTEPKLKLLQDFQDDVIFIGYPGPMTKTATGMYAKFIIPTMFAEVAKGKPVRAAMDDAEKKLRAI
ncbi:MAG TPA: extracellular solute-binding protein [Myxococcales bacterium]|jgi:multiple sugar transport system substrate-binding protein|nr:extracellular solute-binding protein [Myxococcales bacterium]